MSTLTKICVVVLAVLVLIASPVFIQKTVLDPQWRQAFMGEQERRQLAEAQAGNQELAASVWKKYYEQARLNADNLAQQFQSTIAAKDVRVNELGQLLNGQKSRLDVLNADVGSLHKDLETQVALNEALTKQLKTQRDQNADLGDQIRRAQDGLRENLAGIEILNMSNRVLQEQVATLTRENTDLRERLEAGGVRAPAAPVIKPPKIDGTITAVRSDLASLNVGSADGVKKGMEFKIYRGDKFVAHLRVAEVFASSCAGVVTDMQRDVLRGDKATTLLE